MAGRTKSVEIADRDGHEPIGRLINLTAKAMRSHYDLVMTEAGSTFAFWTVLAVLETRGPMIQRQLAELLSVEGPTLTRSLSMMEDQDLVARERTGEDRRAAMVRTTEAGHALFVKLRRAMAQANQALLDGVTAEELAGLRTGLARIRDNSRGAARRSRTR
jgi:DNA-binding MarR family transcriptional regulator